MLEHLTDSPCGIGMTQELISEECLHFARLFFGYQEYEGELLGRQVVGQVVTVQFEVCSDGVRSCPVWWGGRWGGQGR